MNSLILTAMLATTPEVWTEHGPYSIVRDTAVFDGVTDELARMCANDNTIPHDPSLPSWCMQFEHQYYDGSTTASEWFVAWDNNAYPDHTYIRPIQTSCMVETEVCSVRLEGQLEMRRSDGIEGWRMGEDLKLRPVNGTLTNWTNNQRWIYQKDTVGVERSLLYLNSQDDLVLGGDYVRAPGGLSVGFAGTAASTLDVRGHRAMTGQSFTAVRLNPSVTTNHDVYGIWSRPDVTIADGAYSSNIRGAWFDPPSYSLGVDSRVWKSMTVYIGGASTVADYNYALFVDGIDALSVVRGTLSVGALRTQVVDCTVAPADDCVVVEDDNGDEYEVPAYRR